MSRKKRLEISSPINFEHRVHSEFDHDTGIFIDLPPQWNSILSDKNIVRKDLPFASSNNVGANDQNYINQSTLNNRPKPITEKNVEFVRTQFQKVKTTPIKHDFYSSAKLIEQFQQNMITPLSLGDVAQWVRL